MASSRPSCEGIYHHDDGSKHYYDIPVVLTDDGIAYLDFAHAILPTCWRTPAINPAGFRVYRDDRDCNAVTNTSMVSRSSSESRLILE